MRNVVPEVGNRDSAVPVVLAGPVSSVIDEIVREGAAADAGRGPTALRSFQIS